MRVGNGPRSGRLDLSSVRIVGGLLRRPKFQFALELPAVTATALVVIVGIGGIQDPGRNFGIVFTWIVWWLVLLLSITFLGRAWCLVCPLGAVGEWLQRGRCYGKGAKKLGFDMKWPRRLRNLWLPNTLFLLFVWFDNVYGVANNPAYTAYLIYILLGASAIIGLLFERRTFCRYICPLTGFIGIQSMSSPFELRNKDRKICLYNCKNKDCYVGSERGYGCPMFEFPMNMDKNMYCIYCTECLKTCPHNNIRLSFRPPTLDLSDTTKKRIDEAFTAVLLLGTVSLGTAILTNRPALEILHSVGIHAKISMTILYATGVILTLAIVLGFCGLSKVFSKENLGTWRIFANYGYALVPIALFMYLAQITDHALRGGTAIVDVTRYMLQNFPFGYGETIRVIALATTYQISLIQVALLIAGHTLSVYAAYRTFLQTRTARSKLIPTLFPFLVLTLIFSTVNLWLITLPMLT